MTGTPEGSSQQDVIIKLNLNKDFRKAKSLINNMLIDENPELKSHIRKLDVKMAP